jgi:uncharacterized membrane protein YfcA
VALVMAISFMIGGYIGSKLSIYLPEKFMKRAFALLLFFMSIKIFFGK